MAAVTPKYRVIGTRPVRPDATRVTAQTGGGFMAVTSDKVFLRAFRWFEASAGWVNDDVPDAGPLRYRQIEYYRMPMMAYLALDDPRSLTRNDFIRLGLVTGSGDAAIGSDCALPFAEQHLADFEQRYCYDRFWADSGPAPNTRYLCCGQALVVIGDAKSAFYACRDRGVLAQFRHQHFLLFLIAHFQKSKR